MILFQNCSQIQPQAGLIEQQSLYDGAQKIDQIYLASLISDSTLLFSQSGSTNLISLLPEYSDKGSIFISVDLPFSGTLASFAGSTNSEEIRITINNDEVRAYHLTDSSNYSYKTQNIPQGSQRILIALSAGVEPDDLILMVNGKRSLQSAVHVGAPSSFSYVYKSFTSSSVLENFVFNRNLNAAELNVYSRFLAQRYSISQVVFDPQVLMPEGGSPTNNNPSPEFLAAKSVIDNSCISCHNNSNVGDFRNLTQAQFIQKGLVVPGDLAGSKLYYRLNGATSGPGARNMPQGGQLSSPQIQAVTDWIMSL